MVIRRIRRTITLKIIYWLKRILTYLEDPQPEDPLLPEARLAVAFTEGIKKATHRHTNLVKLLTAKKLLKKQFPLANTRDVNFAIEKAVQEMHSHGN